MRLLAISAMLLAARAAASPVDDVYSGGRWIAGDLHEHAAPADRDRDVTFTPQRIAKEAAGRKMEWVVLTPHLRPSDWAGRRDAYLGEWARMKELAAAEHGVTLIPGVEYSVSGLGHFGVSGVDLGTLQGDDFLVAAHAAGAFVVLNHPYAVPTRIPGVSASNWDMSYKPWSRGGDGWHDFDAVEVWNVPLGLANLLSRPGGRTAEERAMESASRTARAERRHLTLVGGSDNHRIAVTPTTWVFAKDASAASVLAALKAGRTCVGGPDAGTLVAKGDKDAAWVGIGGRANADKRVELRWEGTAELFIDGASVGKHEGGYVHDAAAGVHDYRIVVGGSRSGFLYANF